jgi:signal transduction histidine kinase
LAWGAVELPALGEELERLLAARAAESGIELSLAIPLSLVAWADRARLRELLEALLDNALRYTPRGGQVGLRAAQATGAIELEVWDTGPGIAEEERSKVFDRFYRGSAAEQSGQPGTGLGLAIAKAIADAHRAPLWIEGREGGGTAVKLRLKAPGP